MLDQPSVEFAQPPLGLVQLALGLAQPAPGMALPALASSLVQSVGVAAAETCGHKISEQTTICYWLIAESSANDRQLFIKKSYGHKFQQHPEGS